MKTLSLKVYPKEVLAAVRAGDNAQDISWKILGQKWDCIEETEDGDSAENNLGLRILENALDWSIGIHVLRFLHTCAKIKKLPKPFTLKTDGKNFTAMWPSGSQITI